MKKAKAGEEKQNEGTETSEMTGAESGPAVETPELTGKAVSEAAVETPELPPSPFVQIGTSREQDGMMSIMSAWDIPQCGVVVRTKHMIGNFMTVSEVFIPDAGLRDGKVVRSII